MRRAARTAWVPPARPRTARGPPRAEAGRFATPQSGRVSGSSPLTHGLAEPGGGEGLAKRWVGEGGRELRFRSPGGSDSSPSWARSSGLRLGRDSRTRRTSPRESGEGFYEEKKQIEWGRGQGTPKSVLPNRVTPWARKLRCGEGGSGRSLGNVGLRCPLRPQVPARSFPTTSFQRSRVGTSPGPGRVYHVAENGEGGLMFTDQAKQSRRRFELSGAIEI